MLIMGMQSEGVVYVDTIMHINGAEVRKLMRGKAWSMARLSKASGVSYSTIADITHGRRSSVRDTTITAIANGLQVHTEQIATR